MRKKDIFGRIIPGITDVHNRNEFSSYLNLKRWNEADQWISIEISYLKEKVIRQRINYNLFGLLMSFVMAFFTWVILYPSGDPKELEAFPLATICYNFYLKLCETVPGGKNAVIIGLIAAPFVICLVVALVGLIIGAIAHKIRWEKIRKMSKRVGAAAVKKKIEKLGKLYNMYDNELCSLLLYALFAGIFTGGVMIFSSVPAGLNPFEYVIVGLICDVVYGIIFLGVMYVCHLFKVWFGIESYDTFWWGEKVDIALGNKTWSSKDDDSGPPDTSTILDDDDIERILDDVYGSLEGKGRWDY